MLQIRPQEAEGCQAASQAEPRPPWFLLRALLYSVFHSGGSRQPLTQGSLLRPREAVPLAAITEDHGQVNALQRAHKVAGGAMV